MLIEQGVQHGAYSRVLKQHNVFQYKRCFGVNYDMSRITRFLCYFLSLKFVSVLSYHAFPSLPSVCCEYHCIAVGSHIACKSGAQQGDDTVNCITVVSMHVRGPVG